MFRVVDGLLAGSSKFLAVLCATGVLAIMIAITAEVVARLALGRSMVGGYELVESLMVGVAFLGLAYAERKGTHVRVRLVTDRVGKGVGRIMRTFGNVVCVAAVATMAWASWSRAHTSWERSEVQQGIVLFPLWPARYVLAIGLTFLTLELSRTVISTFVSSRHGGLTSDSTKALVQ